MQGGEKARMRFFAIFEALAAVGLVLLLLTQVLRPLIRGTKLFPMFGRRADLQDELVDIREEKDIVELEHEVESERKNLNRLKNVRAVDADQAKKESV